MAEARRITSPDNPRIAAVRKLRKHRERRASGTFVAEGLREVERALQAGLQCQALYSCPPFLASSDPSHASTSRRLQDQAAHSGAFVAEVAEKPFLKIAYRSQPEGLLGVFEQPVWRLADLPRISPALLLVAVGVEKPGNLGAMARTALAAGASAILIPDEVVDPFNPNAIRASTGAVYTLPIVSLTPQALKQYLADRQIRPIAAAIDADRAYTAENLTGDLAVIIGPEDRGLDQQWVDWAQREGAVVRIPMAVGPLDSLNAATAAAVILFEARRQRSAATTHPRDSTFSPRRNP